MSEGEISRFQEGLATFHSVIEERDRAIAQCAEWERSYQIVHAENEMLRNRNLQLEAQLAYYMRHAVELQTQMQSAVAIISDGLAKAKQGASRPNGAAVQEAIESALKTEPVPSFLTEKIDGVD